MGHSRKAQARVAGNGLVREVILSVQEAVSRRKGRLVLLVAVVAATTEAESGGGLNSSIIVGASGEGVHGRRRNDSLFLDLKQWGKFVLVRRGFAWLWCVGLYVVEPVVAACVAGEWR